MRNDSQESTLLVSSQLSQSVESVKSVVKTYGGGEVWKG